MITRLDDRRAIAAKLDAGRDLAGTPEEVEAVIAEVITATPGLKIFGADYFPVVARCAVTGLPIFIGDRVIETDNENNFDVTLVLADAVSVDPSLCVIEPKIVEA